MSTRIVLKTTNQIQMSTKLKCRQNSLFFVHFGDFLLFFPLTISNSWTLINRLCLFIDKNLKCVWKRPNFFPLFAFPSVNKKSWFCFSELRFLQSRSSAANSFLRPNQQFQVFSIWNTSQSYLTVLSSSFGFGWCTLKELMLIKNFIREEVSLCKKSMLGKKKLFSILTKISKSLIHIDGTVLNSPSWYFSYGVVHKWRHLWTTPMFNFHCIVFLYTMTTSLLLLPLKNS